MATTVQISNCEMKNQMWLDKINNVDYAFENMKSVFYSLNDR